MRVLCLWRGSAQLAAFVFLFAGEQSLSHRSDSELGLSVIDRWTYQVGGLPAPFGFISVFAVARQGTMMNPSTPRCYRAQTLAFFENLDMSSSATLDELFRTYRWACTHSNLYSAPCHACART